MRYPCLVPQRLCHTRVKVTLTGELTMSGGIETLCTVFAKCNLTFATKQRFTAEKRMVTAAGTALFSGDPFPSVSNPTGTLVTIGNACLETEREDMLETENGLLLTTEFNGELFGKTYHIFRSVKERNPDGTVNYTRVELV